MTVAADSSAARLSRPSIFTRILVGIDGSPEGLEAARQATRLAAADAEITFLSAYAIVPVAGASAGVPVYLDDDLQRARAAEALEQARDEVAPRVVPAVKIARGRSWDALIQEAEGEQDTLIAVGSHGHSRALGIILGSTTTELVHKAGCSVLVARKAAPAFPQAVVVGVDGSRQSLAAAQVAVDLAERLGVSVRAVVATGGKPVDVDGLVEYRRIEPAVAARSRGAPLIHVPLLEWSEQPPVEALLAASARADLIVVGSRGLHGFSALGSISEQLAHEATCSVLVVRQPASRPASGAADG